MKKILLAIVLMSMMVSCTQKMMTRYYGGNDTICVKNGEKVVEITWKDDNIWILTEPMDSSYIPKTKRFYEDSSWGAMEGEIIIKESR